MIERTIAHKEDIALVREDISGLRRELHESEGRLLNAIRGIEVRRQDFDTLQAQVEDIGRRLKVVEKRR
jgi:hypothetical protein